MGIYILISNNCPKICLILYVVHGEPKASAKTIGYATAGGMLLRQSIDDYKYSALRCLLFIHGLYNNPDETKMDQIRMKLDIDACNRNDCLNAMRLWFRTLIKKFTKSYLKKEENYNNKASAKKLDKLIKESDDNYLIENVNKQKNKSVVFGSASLFTSFNISNNNTINKINNIINNSNNSTT